MIPSGPDRSALAAAAQLCDSPFFLYDLDAISAHLAELKAPGVRLWYACKANPLRKILEVADNAGIGFDVASPGEYQQALLTGVAPERILVTGPAKSENFLRRVLQAGVRIIVVESPEQWRLVKQLASELRRPVDVLIRLQLANAASEKSVLGGSQITAFGMAPEDWQGVDLRGDGQVKVIGVHIFQWSNILGAARLSQIWQAYADAASAFARAHSFQLRILDVGGGLGISYDPKAPSLEWAQVLPVLAELRAKLAGVELWMELGRFAVGRFGAYAARVIDRKRVRGREIVVLDGGMNHLLRPSLVNEPFPVSLLRESAAAPVDFQIHGPLCTALDCLGTLPLPGDLAIGDRLIFAHVGAYGFTESMPFFLCHQGAAEIVLERKQLSQVRSPMQPEEWLR